MDSASDWQHPFVDVFKRYNTFETPKAYKGSVTIIHVTHPTIIGSYHREKMFQDFREHLIEQHSHHSRSKWRNQSSKPHRKICMNLINVDLHLIFGLPVKVFLRAFWNWNQRSIAWSAIHSNKYGKGIHNNRRQRNAFI